VLEHSKRSETISIGSVSENNSERRTPVHWACPVFRSETRKKWHPVCQLLNPVPPRGAQKKIEKYGPSPTHIHHSPSSTSSINLHRVHIRTNYKNPVLPSITPAFQKPRLRPSRSLTSLRRCGQILCRWELLFWARSSDTCTGVYYRLRCPCDARFRSNVFAAEQQIGVCS